MAQWDALLLLAPESQLRVKRLYERKFPIEVRRCLSHWIEEQDWDLASVDEVTAKTYFQTILLKLDELIKDSHYNSNPLTGSDFSVHKDHLLTHFEHSPLDMAFNLSECLQGEKVILDSCEVVQQHSSSATEQTQTALDHKVSELENQTQKLEEVIKALEKEESIHKAWESEVKQLNGLAPSLLLEKCSDQAKGIRKNKEDVFFQMKTLLELAAQIVQTLVSVELPKWKRKQQMFCIGKPVSPSLEHLEKWFSRVVESLLKIVQQLKKLQEQSRLQISPMFNLSEVTQQINAITCSLIKTLIENALVVEKQPVMNSLPHRPLVLRTNVAFSVKLRFLVNLQTLQYGCVILAEFDKDVKEIKAIHGYRQFQFTTINNTKAMLQNGGLVTEWDMSVKEIKANRKRSNESLIRVTEELHVITFSTDLQFAGLKCHVETSSLPLVIVSTTSQSPSAWASVMWYNLCSPQQTSLSLFVDPPALSWEQLSQALSWQFISAGDRELNDDQLNELKPRFVDGPEELVSWSKFSNQKEGPWIWIDGILDLIEKYLKKLWRDGYIMGFVNKKKARALLQSKQSGNFLLRFSESNRDGAISFSWVQRTRNGSSVQAIDPCTKDELSRMSLADHIKKYRVKNKPDNPLIYLYPDIPKDDAFGRYYSSRNEVINDQEVDPYYKKTYVCEVDCPTPLSSSPTHTEMDLDQDLRNIPTPDLLQQEVVEEILSKIQRTGYTGNDNSEEEMY